MKNRLTRFLSFGLIACMALGSVSCGKTSSKAETPEPEEESDSTVYQVGIISSEDNTYYNTMQAGFVDALKDTIGEEHLEFSSAYIDEEHNGESICKDYLSKNVNLIYANGRSALTSASIATMETPIVATGIHDFQTTLHIISDGAWDRHTGRNVTGITAFPAMAEQLSLLIEATPQLNAVGLLYIAGDTDAIYQNELLERYLNQAGIPWKEYEVTLDSNEASKDEEASSEEEEVVEETEVKHDSVITPMDIVKASGKEGSNTNITSIGQTSIISGLLSHDSVRTPRVSTRWNAYRESSLRTVAKSILSVLSKEDCDEETLTEAFPDYSKDLITYLMENREELTEDDLTAKLVSESSSYLTSEDEAPTITEIVTQAATECSVFYFSAGSSLVKDIEEITTIAHENGVSTVAGDNEIGAYTLVDFYYDPYDMGYRAGKQAQRILVKGEDPADIKVGLPTDSDYVKLYNASVAELFQMNFPKSFSEFHEYLETYVPGSNTRRVSKSTEE